MSTRIQNPIEIDTALADLYAQEAKAQQALSNAWDVLHYAVDDTRGLQRGQRSVWYLSNHDAEEKASRMADEVIGFGPRRCISALDRVFKVRDMLTRIREQAAPLNAEFTRRGGWTRAFLVQNAGGHVHSSMHCSTCFPTTQFSWMTTYSGRAETAIVEDAGERACTVCYPSAPVSVLSRPTKMFGPDEIVAQQARDERSVAKVAREQTKIAKALTTDGSEFVVEYDRYISPLNGKERIHREYFKTEAAASQWVVGAIANNKMYDWALDEGKQAAIDSIVAAMAEKHDTSVEEIMADIDRKVTAKIKRDSRY